MSLQVRSSPKNDEKPAWISNPYRPGSSHNSCLFWTGATAGTTTTSNGDWRGRRSNLDSEETYASMGIISCQSELSLRKNRGSYNGQYEGNDQEERDELCVFHREPPFMNMEGSFRGAPNQSPDFSRHATLPLYRLLMFYMLANFLSVYSIELHSSASSTGKLCAGIRAIRRKI